MSQEPEDILAPLPAKSTVPTMTRSDSISAASQDSQTAQEFINSQLQLEADAREAMPYQFDTCTRPLGPLRQTLFSCLTCRPPPADPQEAYTPAGVCYSCSISCHGEHELVELFGKRNFVCDCGTTRLPAEAPCTLRFNESTGVKGDVKGETAVTTNRYNHNFANRFCGCDELYNPHQEKGTMFQCIGLGSVEDGGCGEDWWHPECIIGLPRDWHETAKENGTKPEATTGVTSADHDVPLQAEVGDETTQREHPVPPGFPDEEDFEYFVCYKCVDAHPWLKRYSGAPGFLPGAAWVEATASATKSEAIATDQTEPQSEQTTKKRKLDDDTQADDAPQQDLKRHRGQSEPEDGLVKPELDSSAQHLCDFKALPPAPLGRISLFCKEDFREHICRCPECFPRVKPFPQLLEEEDTYEPPLSEDGDGNGAPSVGTGSLLDRGEAALSNVDRVRAIEGVMVYNHLKDKVKSFLQPFAESGQAVGAEDIKAYFEKLRGDAEGMKQAAAGAAAGSGGEDGGGNRKEQSGY